MTFEAILRLFEVILRLLEVIEAIWGFWGQLGHLRSLRPSRLFVVYIDILEKLLTFGTVCEMCQNKLKFARIFLLMHEKTKSTHQRFFKSLSHQTESLISLGTSWALRGILFHYCVFKPFKGLLIFHRTPFCYVMTVQSISDIDLEIVFLFWATTLL